MAHRPAPQIRRFPPGLDVKLSDVLKSFPLPEKHSYAYTHDDGVNAAADTDEWLVLDCRSNKNQRSSRRTCKICWYPKPPFCPTCNKTVPHDGETESPAWCQHARLCHHISFDHPGNHKCFLLVNTVCFGPLRGRHAGRRLPRTTATWSS